MNNLTQTLRIGFLINDARATFWTLVGQGARTAALAQGVRLTVQEAQNAAEQADVLLRFLVEGVDLLIFLPYDTAFPALRAAIAQVRAAGIPIITCQQGGEQPDEFAVCDVRADLSSGAYLATSYLAERLDGRGTIAHLSAPMSLPRSTGFKTAIQAHPALEAVELVSDWSPERSAELIQAALGTHPGLRAIFAHNDWMAIGAMRAIQAAGRADEILVAGVDAIPEAIQALADGRMATTVYVQPERIGAAAVEIGARLLRGEPVPPVSETPVTLVTRENLLAVALEQLSGLPSIMRTLAESTMAQHALQDAVIDAQHRQIQELSTPVIPISDAILVLPLVGTINAARGEQILETVLAAIERHRAQVFIMDITGVPLVDTQAAHHLLQTARAAQLLGATAILVGITTEIAQTMVQLGVNFSQLLTQSTLQASLEYAAAHLVVPGRF